MTSVVVDIVVGGAGRGASTGVLGCVAHQPFSLRLRHSTYMVRDHSIIPHPRQVQHAVWRESNNINILSSHIYIPKVLASSNRQTIPPREGFDQISLDQMGHSLIPSLPSLWKEITIAVLIITFSYIYNENLMCIIFSKFGSLLCSVYITFLKWCTHPTLPLEKIIKAPASYNCSIYMYIHIYSEPSIHTRPFLPYRLSSLALLGRNAKRKKKGLCMANRRTG